MGAGQMDVDAHPDYYCTGFFLGEPGKAVTADHCLAKLQVGWPGLSVWMA